MSMQNDDELVNPGQSLWTWETVDAWARAKNGAFGLPSPGY